MRRVSIFILPTLIGLCLTAGTLTMLSRVTRAQTVAALPTLYVPPSLTATHTPTRTPTPSHTPTATITPTLATHVIEISAVMLAAYIPAGEPAQFTYLLDPTQTTAPNTVTWTTDANPHCAGDPFDPGAGGVLPTPP